ncbi:uncharacterized protein [Dermacentor albipictus]|uniref:uncharacterized protein isoform X3 n=1 Tax=Dermacentor albipictus TaxID=60249 RepID=UPI0031FC2C0E
MWRQPSCSCDMRSLLDDLRPAFRVSYQLQNFQSGFFATKWDSFDSLVEGICDCYRRNHRRREAMAIVIAACGSQLTHSLEEIFSQVAPAGNKRPIQECRPVSSPECFIAVFGVRSRVPLGCPLLVSSEEALDCLMEDAPELDPLCVKASNLHWAVLLIPAELAGAVLLLRFSYTLSSDPAQMERDICEGKLLLFVQWPEDVICGRLPPPGVGWCRHGTAPHAARMSPLVCAGSHFCWPSSRPQPVLAVASERKQARPVAALYSLRCLV